MGKLTSNAYMFNALLFFVVLPLKLFSQPGGKITLDHYLIGSKTSTEDARMSSTIWYLGSQTIQGVEHIESKKDSTGTHIRTYLAYYLFADSQLNEFLYYKNFSDTAKPVMRFKDADSLFKYGGWNMYSNKKFEFDGYEQIGDTIVGKEKRGRYKLYKSQNGKTIDFILYTAPEKKYVPVKYLKPFSEMLGYPIVRMDIYSEGQLVGISGLTFVTDSLTTYEKKVFKSWQKDLVPHHKN